MQHLAVYITFSVMTQTQALRAAEWSYFFVAAMFIAVLVAGPSLAGMELAKGKVVSLTIFVAVSVVLGLWARRIRAGQSPLTKAFFVCAFSAGTVVGVAFGGLLGAVILGVPFLFVAIAWRKKVNSARLQAQRDR